MKKTILIFIASYLPGFKIGGPLQSILNLTDHLGDKFNFRIVCSDRDLGDSTPYENIQTNKWIPIKNSFVLYIPPDHLNIKYISKILKETPHDILYLNSFFNFKFSIIPLLARKLNSSLNSRILIAPRGEFSHGALSLKKIKKKLFISISYLIGIHRNLTWQASSEYEKLDILSAVKSMALDIRIAPNLPRCSEKFLDSYTREPGAPLKVVFLSRISPKKNLLFACEILSKVKTNIEFYIHGPIEDKNYWLQCLELLKKLPSNVIFEYKGPVSSEDVLSTLVKYDLFFLPTLGENYGHVIAEAFLAGLPVLISDQTPWRDLKELGVGLDLPLNKKDSFVEYIEKLSVLNDAEIKLLNNKINHQIGIISNNENVIDKSFQLFK